MMVNLLIPAMGKSSFFEDFFFPKLMIEIDGTTMLEQVVNNFSDLKDKRCIFVFSQKDVSGFHLDDSARLLTTPESKILTLEHETAGALCSCLMAVDFIDSDEPLIITNCDQIIDVDYNSVLDHFNHEGADAGIISFSNIHPRWSYAKIEDGAVVEVAEKRPLSKNAIAGFYYYRKGRDFVEAAKMAIEKQNHYQGRYYISSTMNELILMGKYVSSYYILPKQYHSFYSPQKISEYEEFLHGGHAK